MDRHAELDSPLATALRLHRLEIDEAISTPYTATVSALAERADLDFDRLLGEHVTVRLRTASPLSLEAAGTLEPRCFDGIVEQITLAGQIGRHHAYRLTLRPWFWFLSQTQDCRVFQNLTVLQIIETVLKDHPQARVEQRTTAAFTPWTYCVQYRESDFQFLSRLMEQEGIGYYFRHGPGQHTLVLFDSVSGHDPCPGCDPLPVRHQDSGRHVARRECVHDWHCSARVQPGAVVLQDYDFTRPSVNLQQRRAAPAAHALGDQEVFDYPGGYDAEADGEHFVRNRLDALAAHTREAGGRSDARNLACGGLIRLQGALRPADDTEYLVTGTRITVDVPDVDSGQALLAPGYQCAFDALDTAVPWRSPRRTPKPVVQGPQTAVVVGPAGQEIHTDRHGRVKVQFHWDRLGRRDEHSSCWVRVSSPWAGKSFGFIQVPRIGQEVIVDFLEGDPDQPIITGRVYNAEQMPPWDLPANATQSGVLTRSSQGGAYGNANAIRFEDKAGAEQLWIHAEKDQAIEVENDESHSVGHDRAKTVGHDETVSVGHDRTETVGRHETITIGANRTESVGANERITVAANRSEQVGANETIAIGANRSVTVGGSETATVALQRTHAVGVNETIAIGAAQEVAIGGAQIVAVGALQSVSVGASQTTTVGVNQSVDVGAAQSTTVGARQSTRVGADRSVDVGGAQSLKVGKARSTQIGEDDSVKVGKNWVLEAGDSITLKTGNASITLKKDGTIVIKGKDITLDGSGKINVKASSDVVVKGSKVGIN